jgi:hypothetical protein
MVKTARSGIVMNKTLKKTLYFSIIYFILDILSVLLIFAWTSYGGRDSMNLLQKIVSVLFSFPGLELNLNDSSLILYLLVNTAFWTLIFYALLRILSGLRKA